MWTTGVLLDCEGCTQPTEAIFQIVTAARRARLCPECMRQQAEAAILEAEATGMSIPLNTPPLADDVADASDFLEEGKAAFLSALLEVCDRAELPVRQLLDDPLIQLELGMISKSKPG